MIFKGDQAPTLKVGMLQNLQENFYKLFLKIIQKHRFRPF